MSGIEEDLVWLVERMRSWFELKVRAKMGGDKHDDKESTLLGRIVRWTSRGITCEADPKHRELVMKEYGKAYEEAFKTLMQQQ